MKGLQARLGCDVSCSYVLESCPDAILIANSKGQIEYCNNSAKRVFGYERESLIGQNGSLLLPSSIRNLITSSSIDEFANCHADDLGRTHLALGLKHDGRVFPIEFSIQKLQQGEVHFYLGFVRDISERKALEDLATQSLAAEREARIELAAVKDDLMDAKRRVEESSLVKEQFLAMVSHELRTPLTAMLGFLDILKESLESRSDLDIWRTIRSNGDHLLKLVDDLLDLNRINAGLFHIDYANCDAYEILRDTCAGLRKRANKKGLSIQLDCLVDHLPLETDPVRLRQVLLHLIDNAIKFTSEGEINIRLSAHADQEPGFVLITVDDTGPGFTATQLQHVEDYFSRSEMAPNEGVEESVRGLGLGLALAFRLSRLLGGSLMVENLATGGSRLSLKLPLRQLHPSSPNEANREDAHTADKSKSSLLGIHVLVVEDGPDNQRLISHVLKKHGATVEIAENGSVALSRLLSLDKVEGHEVASPIVDVVLMDMQMPVCDGYEATSRLRAAGYSKPIVALTAHAMAGDREKCMAAGCDEYLTKPMDRAALIKTVKLYADQAKNGSVSHVSVLEPT